MWKFKTSKFKNASPKIPKKDEWVTSVNAANLLNSCGNHIQASNKFFAFNTDSSGGGCLGILPINASGRQDPGSIPSVQAHSSFVTDFQFSPHDDRLLATCSHDGCVKLWSILDELPQRICEADSSICLGDTKIENVLWHPLASNVLSVTSGTNMSVLDVEKETELYGFDEHSDLVLSMSWKGDGSQVLTACKDKTLSIFDPRNGSRVQEAVGHPNARDCRVIWLADKDLVLSSGFGSMRQREISLRDPRNFSSAIKTVTADTSSGVLMPFYDADTGMLFAAGKGDTCVRYYEVTATDILENSQDAVEQIKGLAMVPKRSMDVMKCEVNRLMLLAKSAVIPLPIYVPRKNYNDFHDDLFPDTFDGKPTMTSDEWWNGENRMGGTVGLNPSAAKSRTSSTPQKAAPAKVSVPEPKPVEPIAAAAPPVEPQMVELRPKEPVYQSPSATAKRESTSSRFSVVRQAKFRHLEGSPLHKSLHIDNLRNLSKNVPGECDAFHVNKKFAAVPLGGAGGLIAILKLADTGRLPDTGVPALQNSSQITDFAFDPFDDHKLVVGCEDAKIRVWTIPEEGLTETVTEWDSYLSGHNEKVYLVKFHPLAQDILASASYDMTVRLWDMTSEVEIMQLTGHTDTIFCLSWSQSGSEFATACKDGILRVYDPRASTTPIREGKGPAGTRGARILWVFDDQYLIVSGFGSMSRRDVYVYDAQTLSVLHTVDLDNSPAILIPHFDEGSSTLFLTGRGDSTVRTFEVSTEHPHLFALSDHRAESLHQALSFLPQNEVNVRKVEFAKAYRLTSNTIEPLSFTVPRKRDEFFQDDLFPEVKVSWEPTMTSQEWLDGGNTPQKMVSLKPSDMTPLSEAPEEEQKAKKFVSYEEYRQTYKSDEQKKEELLSAMTNKMELHDTPLPQDLTEGCDDDEWDD